MPKYIVRGHHRCFVIDKFLKQPNFEASRTKRQVTPYFICLLSRPALRLSAEISITNVIKKMIADYRFEIFFAFFSKKFCRR